MVPYRGYGALQKYEFVSQQLHLEHKPLRKHVMCLNCDKTLRYTKSNGT